MSQPIRRPAAGSLQADLSHALEEPITQFVLHYQPVVDLSSGRVVAVESLLRWQHPVLGLLGPGRFIALAEESGLMNRVGDWALERACIDAATLTHEGRPLDLSVNVSPSQLDENIVDTVQRALRTSGLPPHRLTIEVTESMFARDQGLTAATYRELAQLGIRFAVDDFGTGFSSLLHLRRFPIDVVKIDGEVVSGVGIRPNDEASCDSILGLAAAVGASSVAEGVETVEQYAVLRTMGCRRGQGYLWSPAVPLADLPAVAAACERVPVPERAARLPRVEKVTDQASTIIARMHAEGASTHEIAAALNRTVGRHPSGVRWTAGAVARGLPVPPA